MDGNYSIYRNGVCAGSAEVKKQGLYYHFSCRCDLREGERIHLKVTCDNRVTDLGLCVPMDDSFGVETSVPVKKVGSGTQEFFLGDRKVPAKELPAEKEIAVKKNVSEQTVQVSAEQPFEHLAELDGAVLEEAEGEKVIRLNQPVPEQPDSDQSPSPESE